VRDFSFRARHGCANDFAHGRLAVLGNGFRMSLDIFQRDSATGSRWHHQGKVHS
jgi:hypothetical protein